MVGHARRLITERELQLFDGTRLLGEERYGAVKVETGLSDEQLSLRYYCCVMTCEGRCSVVVKLATVCLVFPSFFNVGIKLSL